MSKVHAVIPREQYSNRKEYNALYQKQWRANQTEEWKEAELVRKRKIYHDNTAYYPNWQKENVNSRLCSIAKSRAKKKNLEFDITKEDVIVPTHCPILGIELTMNQGSGAGGKYNSFSLDRIDSSKGYVKGNVQVISHLANNMKSYATKEDLLKFAEWIMKEYTP